MGIHEAGRRTDSRVGHRERHAVSVSMSPGDPSHREQPSRKKAPLLPNCRPETTRLWPLLPVLGIQGPGPHRWPVSRSALETGPASTTITTRDPQEMQGLCPSQELPLCRGPWTEPSGVLSPLPRPGASPTHLPGVGRPAQVGRSTGVVTGSRPRPTCFTASVCPPGLSRSLRGSAARRGLDPPPRKGPGSVDLLRLAPRTPCGGPRAACGACPSSDQAPGSGGPSPQAPAVHGLGAFAGWAPRPADAGGRLPSSSPALLKSLPLRFQLGV